MAGGTKKNPLGIFWQRVKKHLRCYCGADVDGDGEVDMAVGWTGNETVVALDVETQDTPAQVTQATR